MSVLRISLYDDNNDFRETLALLIGTSTDDMAVVGSHPDCTKVVETVAAELPDIILMDIDMPEVTGIEAVKKIRAFSDKPKILMLTVYEQTERIFQAIEAGAVGYLLKKTAPDRIIESIYEIKNGGAAMSPSIALKVMAAFQKPVQRPNPYQLTDKETEVLKRLVEGDSYKLIAYHCQISIGTVQTHILHIYQKLHVNSKGEAITKALRDGLV
jgi:DNA-binding NarL/FixJ family response regulator